MIPAQTVKRINRRVSSSPFMLDLDYMKIKGQGLDYLLKKIQIRNMKSISLIQNELQSSSISAFSMKEIPCLIFLSLSWNRIGDLGCKYLVRANFPILNTLELNGVGMGDEGISYLAKVRWKKLESISLSGNNITGNAWKVFVRMGLPKLANINLYGNLIDHSTIIAMVLTEKPLKEINLVAQKISVSKQLDRKVINQVKKFMTKKYGTGFILCNRI